LEAKGKYQNIQAQNKSITNRSIGSQRALPPNTRTKKNPRPNKHLEKMQTGPEKSKQNRITNKKRPTPETQQKQNFTATYTRPDPMSIHTKGTSSSPTCSKTIATRDETHLKQSVIKNSIISYLPNNPNKSQPHNQKSLSYPLIPSMTNQLAIRRKHLLRKHNHHM
jgi:hypothetical protein